jgi:predicted amidohydrolase
MRITAIQLEIRERSKRDRLNHVIQLVEEAPPSDLILLPEMWTCGFFSFEHYKETSEPQDGPTVERLRETAVQRRCFILMGSIVEREGRDLFNSTLLLDPQGNIVARYRKIHLFGYQSEERRLLKPGTEVVVAETPWGKAGLSTCYDLRFPEFYRKMADSGATFFLVVSAWPQARLEAWTLFNRVRAHENLAYLFSCNCAGLDHGHAYAGHSMFIDPLGKVVAEGGEEEVIVSADVDTSLVDSVREEFGFLNDRVFK